MGGGHRFLPEDPGAFSTMLAAIRARSRAVARPLAARSQTTLPIPTPPPGSQTVFPCTNMPPKYSLAPPTFTFMFIAANLGAYSGHYFFLYFFSKENPPNPPRNPNEERPEKHLHTVD